MHSQLIFLMRTCHFIIVKKRIAVTPGITGETISSCRRPVLFGSRVLCEIDLLRYNNKSHVLLLSLRLQVKGSDSSMKVRIKCINAVSNKSE